MLLRISARPVENRFLDEITERRPGDIAECYANASLAKEELGWEAEYGIKEMCEDTWNWQKKNPNWI